jgi:hypothetical protein
LTFFEYSSIFRAACLDTHAKQASASRTIQTQNYGSKEKMMDGDAPYGACDDDDATHLPATGAQNMPRSDSA